jgi:predicted DNA-binding protein (MmcQ/YjbR family)
VSAADKKAGKLRDQVLEYALSLPEAWEDHPWGESVVKVRKKIFVFLDMGHGDHPAPGMNVKLPQSADHALSMPDAVPTGYGLGRSGWVSLRFGDPLLPLEVLTDFVAESYCAIAPKTLVAQLLEEQR